jgi:hypothetical protein
MKGSRISSPRRQSLDQGTFFSEVIIISIIIIIIIIIIIVIYCPYVRYLQLYTWNNAVVAIL